ncbi:hypothetical protein NL676_022937 [Syzygium grande]|nr:hypothetical protein NL676_022937 [Syzygium grande]
MKALGLQKNLGWPKELGLRLKTPAPLAYYAIRKKLRSLLGEHDKAKYVLTGHSLGGALAILFLAILAVHGDTWLMERLEGFTHLVNLGLEMRSLGSSCRGS